MEQACSPGPWADSLANQQHVTRSRMSLGGYVPRNFPSGAGAAIWSAFNRVTNFVTNNGSVVVAAAGNESLDLNRIGPFVVLPADSPHVISVTATTNPGLLPPTPPTASRALRALLPGVLQQLRLQLTWPGGSWRRSSGRWLRVCGVPCFRTGSIPGAAAALDYPAPLLQSLLTILLRDHRCCMSWGCFVFCCVCATCLVRQAAGTPAQQHLWPQPRPHSAKSAEPRLSPSQIRTIFQPTAQDIGKPGYDELFNFGLVNAAAAVRHADYRNRLHQAAGKSFVFRVWVLFRPGFRVGHQLEQRHRVLLGLDALAPKESA